MTTTDLWFATPALAVLAAMICLALLDFYGLTAWPAVRKLWCAAKNQRVVARFRMSPFSTRYTDVESCSAFAPGAELTCGKQCLAKASSGK